MKQPAPALTHAKAAVDCAAASIGVLRARLQAGEAGLTRQQLLIGRDLLHELERRHGLLAGLYAGMVTSTPEDLAVQCQEFFSGYDDYLDAARRARPDLVHEELHPCIASQLKRGANP